MYEPMYHKSIPIAGCNNFCGYDEFLGTKEYKFYHGGTETQRKCKGSFERQNF
jgi:hypothetical protein